MSINRLLLAGSLAMGLASCATLGILSGGVKNPLTPQFALTMHASFDLGVVVASGRYADLARCPAPQPCSQQVVVNSLRKYVNAAEDVLNQLDEWAYGNPRLDGPALYAAAVGAITTAERYATQFSLKFTPVPGI